MKVGDIVKFKDSALSILKAMHGTTGFVVEEGIDHLTIQWMHNNKRMKCYEGSYAYRSLEKVA